MQQYFLSDYISKGLSICSLIAVPVLIVYAIKTLTGRKCEHPRWYQTSFVFVLIGLQLLSIGPLSPIGIRRFGVIAMLLAVINARNDDWYKHRWPWFIVALLSWGIFTGWTTLLIATANPDPVVSVHQGVRPLVAWCAT
jgi:hypothetical protein